MKQLVENLLSLGRRRLIILGGVGVAIILALLVGLTIVTAPNFVPLLSQMSPASASGVVDALQKAGVDSRVSPDGTSVSVPQQDLARARMKLAEQGLPADGSPGWELFDNTSGLGMNSFLQQVTRLRAMEGELARSIQTLDGVRSARVHLVLPEREAFSRQTTEPSASVIVRMSTGLDLERRHALAIRDLIASAVAGLSPSHVTVLSANGEVILAAEGDGANDPQSMQTAKAAIEDRMERSIDQILTARVGAGNARVQVAVELNPDRQVVVQQTFNPDQQVVRSTDSRNERAQGHEADNSVGVTSNLPPALAGPTSAGGNTTDSSKSGEQVTYEIGNTRSETTTEAGDIKRISVAVLVNGIYNVDASGKVDYAPRPPEEIARLTQLVQSAVGYEKSRGDAVSVDSLRFMDYSMDVGEPIGPSILQRLSNNIVLILRWLAGLAVVGLVLGLGVRPVLYRLLETPQQLPVPHAPGALSGPGGEASGKAMLTNASAGAEEVLPEQGAPHAASGSAADFNAPAMTSSRPHIPRQHVYAAAPPDSTSFFEAISVPNSALKRRADAIRALVDDDPNEAMKVLRTWLASGA